MFVVDEEFLVVLYRACLWGQCQSVLYVFTLQSQPLWFIPVNAMQPDIYSLTHRLFLPFHHFWICCCHVCCKWVEKQAGRPTFIPVMCSPHSWAASVKPSTLPRPLWRRSMPDVSFTKTNRKITLPNSNHLFGAVLVSITRFIESKMIPPISDGLQWISN